MCNINKSQYRHLSLPPLTPTGKRKKWKRNFKIKTNFDLIDQVSSHNLWKLKKGAYWGPQPTGLCDRWWVESSSHGPPQCPPTLPWHFFLIAELEWPKANTQLSLNLKHRHWFYYRIFLPSVFVSCCRRVLPVIDNILWILQNRTTSLHSSCGKEVHFLTHLNRL